MAGQHSLEEQWSKLYPLLRVRIACWVNTARVPMWTRQREDIIEDLVQDTLLKMFIYAQENEKEIASLEHFSTTTAYRCFIDLRRRDLRVLPLDRDDNELFQYDIKWSPIDPSEQAINNVNQEQIFESLAMWVIRFPDKQKTAILTDMANRMYFDPVSLTPLQQAFANVGICLFDYQQPLPDDAVMRARHAAHLSLAYKRLTLQAYLYQYMFVAAPLAA